MRDLDQYTVFLKFLSPPPKDSKIQEKLGFPGHSEPEQRQSKKEENSLSPLWNKNNGTEEWSLCWQYHREILRHHLKPTKSEILEEKLAIWILISLRVESVVGQS